MTGLGKRAMFWISMRSQTRLRMFALTLLASPSRRPFTSPVALGYYLSSYVSCRCSRQIPDVPRRSTGSDAPSCTN